MLGRRLLTLACACPLLLAAGPLASAHAATPSCHGRVATLLVTSRSAHVVNGTSRSDVIVILAAGHVVNSGLGNDLVCGSGGADTVNGGAGSDLLDGAGGNDVLSGGDGNDRWEPDADRSADGDRDIDRFIAAVVDAMDG